MLEESLVSFTSLLAISKAAYLGHGPASIDHNPELRSRSVPDIAAIKSVPPKTFESYTEGGLMRGGVTVLTEGEDEEAAAAAAGDEDDGGVGVTITNADTAWRAFYIYYNSCDSVPYKYVWVDAGATVFVSLPAMFQGRITRGTDEWNLGGVPRPLGTWFELALDNDSRIWGDVSLIRGCDGGMLMWALDSSGSWKGFTQDILDGAPSGVYDVKPSGQEVIAATENWDGTTNWSSMVWDLDKVGPEFVYVDDAHGNPVIASKNGRFGSYWPPGRL